MKFNIGDMIRAIVNTGTYSIGDEFIVTSTGRRVNLDGKYIEYIGFNCSHPEPAIASGNHAGFRSAHFELANRRCFITKKPKNLPNLERKDTI